MLDIGEWFSGVHDISLFKWNDKGIARVISRKNNGHVHVYIGPYKPSRFKSNTFIIILKHFQK